MTKKRIKEIKTISQNYTIKRGYFKHVLESKGMTIKDLSEIMGMKYDTLYRKLKRSYFTIHEVLFLCLLLEMNFEDLFLTGEY